MFITAKDARGNVEKMPRVEYNLVRIDRDIKISSDLGIRKLTHIFTEKTDDRRIRKQVIEDLRLRGFKVRYSIMPYLLGMKEISIKW